MRKLPLILIILFFQVNAFGAITEGTNAGFVTTAPTGDPAGTGLRIDARAIATKHTSPVGATNVTEMGWWCDTTSEESNYEIGIYDHDATNNKPGNLLAGADTSNAKGTTSGWKTATGLNISISPNTVYWLAVQLDDTVTLTNTDSNTDASYLRDIKETETALTDPWGTSDAQATRITAFYAVYTTTQVIVIQEQ